MSWLAPNRLIPLQLDFWNQLEAILANVLPATNGRQSIWHLADSRISCRLIWPRSVRMVGTGGAGMWNVWCWQWWTCSTTQAERQGSVSIPMVNSWPKGGFTAGKTSPFVAFDTFVSRRLCPGETVDEYLGDLQDLARLIEENTSDRWLSCAFMSGLHGPVRRQLRGSLRMEHMTLEQILARAWALMTEEAEVDEPVAAAAGWRRVLPHVSVVPPSTPDKQNAVAVQCNKCGGPTLPETVGSLGANHEERSRRYAVISANNKDMSHRGVRKMRQGVRGRDYSLPT